MKKLTLFLILSLIYCTPVCATLQTDLEAEFDIVETFDQLQDWSPTLSSGSIGTFTNQLPVKIGGGDSIWDFWDFYDPAGSSGVTFIGGNGGITFNGSSKSLKLNINDSGYPGRFGVYFGGGSTDAVDPYSTSGVVESGYRTDIYIFWMSRHTQTNFVGYPYPYPDQSGCHKIGTVSMGFTSPTTSSEGDNNYGAANSHWSIWGGATYGDHLHYVLQWFSDAEWSEVVAQDITAVRTLHAGSTYLDQLYIEDSEWYGTEIHIHLGTPGVADGYQEIWTYDYLGNATYGGKSSNMVMRQTGKNWGLNRAFWGGNQCGITTDTSDYYVDDIIIDEGRIGPGYFEILSGTPSYAQPTVIAGDDTTVYAAMADISGTYTIDSGLTATAIWEHGSYSGFCTLIGGVLTGTVTNLTTGANTITVTITDSEGQEDSDTVIITRESLPEVSGSVTSTAVSIGAMIK